jgi:REP element-mobilizing transposase RayT
VGTIDGTSPGMTADETSRPRSPDEVPPLRRRSLVKIIRDSIAASQRDDFSIVHFAIESNHLHFIIETASGVARARGITGLKVRISKRVNKIVGRTGELFADR